MGHDLTNRGQGVSCHKQLCNPTNKPFKFTSAGMLACIGTYEGLSDISS